MKNSEKGYLFILRLWKEELDGGIEVRGQLEDANSHESYYFRSWDSLLVQLKRHLPYSSADPSGRSSSGRKVEADGGGSIVA